MIVTFVGSLGLTNNAGADSMSALDVALVVSEACGVSATAFAAGRFEAFERPALPLDAAARLARAIFVANCRAAAARATSAAALLTGDATGPRTEYHQRQC